MFDFLKFAHVNDFSYTFSLMWYYFELNGKTLGYTQNIPVVVGFVRVSVTIGSVTGVVVPPLSLTVVVRCLVCSVVLPSG